MKHQNDWTALEGMAVEIYLEGQLVRVGTVESVMPDSSILWIRADGNHSRMLFEAESGYQVYPSFVFHEEVPHLTSNVAGATT